MQENEFEKQVKDIMDELRVHPSESVWENVKKHLIKRKRRLLPFFLLFAAIAVTGGYLIYSMQKQTKPTTNNKSLVSNNNSSPKTISPIASQEKNILPQKADTIKSASGQLIINKTRSSQSLKKIKEPVKDEIAYSSSKTINSQTESSKNNNQNSFVTDAANNNFLTKENSNQNKINAQPQAYNTNDSTRFLLKQTYDDTISKKPNQINQQSQTAKKKQTDNSKKIKQSKWQFGLTAMYGDGNISSFANLSLEKSLPSATYLNSGQAAGTNVVQLDHPYNTSAAYKFGIEMQRNISRNSFLYTGINYTHLSAKSLVATSTNASLVPVALSAYGLTANYYQLGTEQIFKSNYNFIEIPIAFQSNIFHVKKFSLAYNAGTSVRKIISSQPLIYDDYSNSFSKDESLLKHTQFQLSAGLMLQLKLTNNSMISLGPQFEYSLTKFAQTNNFHFFNYGLQATLHLGKK